MSRCHISDMGGSFFFFETKKKNELRVTAQSPGIVADSDLMNMLAPYYVNCEHSHYFLSFLFIYLFIFPF